MLSLRISPRGAGVRVKRWGCCHVRRADRGTQGSLCEHHSFFLMAAPAAYGRSCAREWNGAAAATYTTATTTSGPLTHYAGPGIEPEPPRGSNPSLPRDPTHCSRILNPLNHGGNTEHHFLSLSSSLDFQNLNANLKIMNSKRRQ